MSTEIVSPRMRLPEVRQVLQCSTSHVYRLAKSGALRRYTEAKRFTYWKRSEVMALAEGRNPYAAEETETDNQETKKPTQEGGQE